MNNKILDFDYEDLDVLRNTTIHNDLSVLGNISANIKSLDDNTYLFGNMFISDNLEILNNIDVLNDINIYNNATVTNDLNVIGNTTLDYDLTVDNNCIINNNLNVSNNSVFNTVDVLSNIAIYGDINLPNINSSILIDDIPVISSNTLGKTIIYSSIQQLGNLSNLSVIGNTNITNLISTGLVTIDNNTDSNNTNGGALVISGGVGISKKLNIGSDLNVSGNITANKNLLLYGSLNASGNVVFTSNANATNYTTAPFVINGGMAVSKDLYVSSNLVSKSIDTLTGETLNIAHTRASIINIGSGATNQTINIGRSNTIPKDIYIGTGIAGSRIFIGSEFASVTIRGNTQYTNATNLTITNKNIYLNENAVGSGLSYNAGIYIRDNNDDLAGYIL